LSEAPRYGPDAGPAGNASLHGCQLPSLAPKASNLAEGRPPGPSLLAQSPTLSPGPAPIATDQLGAPPNEQSWLRVSEGKLQQKILLQNLPTFTKYNGSLGWVDAGDLSALASPQPRLVAVSLSNPDRVVQANSSHIFPLGPMCASSPRSKPLFVLPVRIKTPQGLVQIRALVDTGCELEGILSSRLVQQFGLEAYPSQRPVRTVSGEVLTGMSQSRVQTVLAPGFTRCIAYGVLDVPGFDAILGMQFLRQCAPFTLQWGAAGARELHLRIPSSGRLVVLPCEPCETLQVPASGPVDDTVSATAADAPASSFTVQWSVPEDADYDAAVAAFCVEWGPPGSGSVPVLRWLPSPQHDPALRAPSLTLQEQDLEEGLVFATLAGDSPRRADVPAAVSTQSEALLS